MKNEIKDQKKELLSRIRDDKEWVFHKYGEKRLYDLLDLWLKAAVRECKKAGVTLTEDEILKYFHTSYFRYLANYQNNRKILIAKIQLMIDRIEKEKLLARVSKSLHRDSQRWKQYKLAKIQQRLDIWEKGIRDAVPGIKDEDIFAFFRIRYLGVDDHRFVKVELSKGIKNMKKFVKKKGLLNQLFITPGHPQYEEWMPLAFWEFERRIMPLFSALKRFRSQTLDFPSTSKSFTKNEFSRYIQEHSDSTPAIFDEMFFKLVLYFKGISERQLNHFLEDIHENRQWEGVQLRESIDRLTHIGLLEEKDIGEMGSYIIPAGEDVVKEHVLEKWIDNLRKKMSIGTGEALSYLSPKYRSHSLDILKQSDIPKATQKLLEDRKKMLQMLYMYPDDPRFSKVLKMSPSEITKKIRRINLIIDAYKQNNLVIDPEWEEDIDYYAEEELSEKDVKVFKLITRLRATSFKQLAEIHKRMNKGKIGFSLKWSLQKLCRLGLLTEPRTNFYRVLSNN